MRETLGQANPANPSLKNDATCKIFKTSKASERATTAGDSRWSTECSSHIPVPGIRTSHPERFWRAQRHGCSRNRREWMRMRMRKRDWDANPPPVCSLASPRFTGVVFAPRPLLPMHKSRWGGMQYVTGTAVALLRCIITGVRDGFGRSFASPWHGKQSLLLRQKSWCLLFSRWSAALRMNRWGLSI